MAISTNVTSATGSLFGAVAASAGSVTSLFTAVTHGLTMVDEYAKNALRNQQDRILADRVDFREKLIEDKASEMATRKLQVVEFCNQSPAHHEQYKSSYTRLADAFAEADAAKAKANASNTST